MTKEEIKKFLDNTKIYVNGRSEEIQKKLFSLGYMWPISGCEVCHTESPFLFASDNNEISHSRDMEFFKKREYTEITAEQILSLELTECYRPFKDKKECWREMQQHQPCGWVCHNSKHCQILEVGYVGIRFVDLFLTFDQAVNDTFADGTPFGIKE